ncbi:MAG: DUF4412 domain-containing protein [Bacteroidia bacterium]
MKHFLAFLLLFGLISLSFAQHFAGTIHAKLQNNGGTSELRYHLAAEKVALEMRFQAVQGDYSLSFAYPYQDEAHLLAKTDKSGEKSAMILPLTSLGAKLRTPSDYRLVAQNEKKIIAGFECEKYQLLTNDFLIEAWICPKITPNLEKMAILFKDEHIIQAMNAVKVQGFPLESVVKTTNGAFVQSQTVSLVVENQENNPVFELGEYKLIENR